MKNLNKISSILAILVISLGGNAVAVEKEGTIQVNASIVPSCKVNMSNNISLPYSPGAESNGTTFLTAICTKTTTYEIGINKGFGSSETTRVLKSGENILSYSIHHYQKVGDGLLSYWGDIGSPNAVKHEGIGVEVFHIVAVNIPQKQYVPSGLYTDELVVTFNY